MLLVYRVVSYSFVITFLETYPRITSEHFIDMSGLGVHLPFEIRIRDLREERGILRNVLG